MINHKQLREFVIKPSLNAIGLYSESAEELLVMTCAQESLGGSFLKQINGPALGIYQCEPETYKDICMRKLYEKDAPGSMVTFGRPAIFLTGLGMNVMLSLGWNPYYNHMIPEAQNLITNLAYATMICRIDYLQESEPLPDKNDLTGLFNYYKKYYNTMKGKATEREVMDNYQMYLRGR